MPLLVVYNPVCGNGTAKVTFDDHVLPLLAQHRRTVDKLVETETEGHAGRIVLDFIRSVQVTRPSDITIILGSGDGTLHEIINILSAIDGPGIPQLRFALVPCGTANALYSSLYPPDREELDSEYKLQSVKAYLNGGRSIPLTLAITTLSSPPAAKERPKVSISAVVVSTAMHASILHDSEALRKEMPGLERFKVAAQNNSTKWYNSYVKLLPAPIAGVVQMYDPKTQSFIDHPDSTADDPIVDLYGPFAYFLATVNVDRLEPTFQITPLSSRITPIEAACDLVMVRPLRDPSISWDQPDARKSFAEKLWTILGSAYQNGGHIELRYTKEGRVVSNGEGPVVVEYVRCGGWEWLPDDVDEDAHLLCSDGAISQIEKGGRAVCTAAAPQGDAGFMVFV